ncbi:MAG: hypothetical protein ACR2MD_01090 [Aridibacter sp.]
MLWNTLNGEGLSSHTAQMESESTIIYDGYLRYTVDKTLTAYEVSASGTPEAVTGFIIEGRFYSETDAAYTDLETGDDLSSKTGTYERYLIRITAGPSTQISENHIQLILTDTI